jgi:hypothetical protein
VRLSSVIKRCGKYPPAYFYRKDSNISHAGGVFRGRVPLFIAKRERTHMAKSQDARKDTKKKPQKTAKEKKLAKMEKKKG